MFGLGMDIIEIKRIEQALTRRPKLEQRLFAKEERDYCWQRPDPFSSFAARFAAKEAVLKAMEEGIGSCALKDIIIRLKPSGAPLICLRENAARLAAEKGIKEIKITLTHSKEYAAATAVAIGGKCHETAYC